MYAEWMSMYDLTITKEDIMRREEIIKLKKMNMLYKIKKYLINEIIDDE